ncbi:MAG: glycosyl hydrolase 2 galactose-binding domain-containing protein [Phycisphaerae bacterium]
MPLERAEFPLSRRTLLAAGGAALLSACAGPSTTRAAKRAAADAPANPHFMQGWQLQSSEKITLSGEQLSMPNGAAGPWYNVDLPSTVLAALVANGEYPDLFTGDNLQNVPRSRFFHTPAPAEDNEAAPRKKPAAPFRPISWWYRKEFRTPADTAGKQLFLYFKGINYRANIFLNGKKIADAQTAVGTYRDLELNITGRLATDNGPNALAVEVFPPDMNNDLAITFVDWAPHVPDANMGLWQDVELRTSGPVSLRHPFVETDFDPANPATATLRPFVDLTNHTDKPISGMLTFTIDGEPRYYSSRVFIPAGQTVTFNARQYENTLAIPIEKPRLWWPWQLGEPELYTLRATFLLGDSPTEGEHSDSASLRFGIRKVTSRLLPPPEGDTKESLLFTVNGIDMLLLGGGYAPDLLQRRTMPDRPDYQEDQVRYAKAMNLNTIRLEGKLEDDHFYDLCDEHGMLVMAGWCCCSPWEKWKSWKQEQHDVAMASLRYQIRRFRQHPSAVAWLNGSDNPPPADIERQYLAIEKELRLPVPTISSATAKKADSGPSGVKMEGPYKWVPPIYWLADKTKGGAHGFNTEVGPGAVPPPVESLEKMLPPGHRWPMDGVWEFHAGGGTFGKITDFTDALNARFGAPNSLADFAWKSQAQAYETIRAMYEAFRRNKFNSGGGATGEIQWMLNNAWPSTIWHLYDYYLRPGAAYFATRIACEPLHALYSYDNHSIVIANDTLRDAPSLTITADIYDIHSQKRHTQSATLTAPANKSVPAFTLDIPSDISPTFFLRLTLTDPPGKTVSTNSYFLSAKPDVMDWNKEVKDDWAITPTSRYADFTQLQSLPPVKLSITPPRVRHFGEEDEARVTVTNSSDSIALFVRARLLNPADNELLPIRWSDNYIMLLPGEARPLSARYLASDARGADLHAVVDCFNNARK